MEQDIFKINRQVKSRAREALTANFFSILKLWVVPVVLYIGLNMFHNDFLSFVAGLMMSLLGLAFYPYASTLMALQARNAQEARNYAKGWSWFGLFNVWKNKIKMGFDYLLFTFLVVILGIGVLLGFVVSALAVGALFQEIPVLSTIMIVLFGVLWTAVFVWVALKLSLTEYAFGDAVFGSAGVSAFDTIDMASMSMLDRLGAIVRMSWKLMTWRVFWRYIWLGLTFLGWFVVMGLLLAAALTFGFTIVVMFIFGGLALFGWLVLVILVFGAALVYVLPYMMMAYIAFYEQIVAEKYGPLEEVEAEVVTITTGVKIEILEPKTK